MIEPLQFQPPSRTTNAVDAPGMIPALPVEPATVEDRERLQASINDILQAGHAVSWKAYLRLQEFRRLI